VYKRQPDATTVIPPEGWQAIVWPQPLGSLLYAGPAAQRALGQYGIRTIGALAAAEPALPERLLGKLGRQLWDFANGRDESPVRSQQDREPVKSVGNSFTFRENLTTREQVLQGMSLLCDSVASRLRQQGLYCGAVQIGLRDPAFHDLSRQKHLPGSTHSMRELLRAAMELTDSVWKPPSPLRLLSITALALTNREETYVQESLFVPQRSVEKQERLEEVVDTIRKKYGGKAIAYGDAAGQAGRLHRTDED